MSRRRVCECPCGCRDKAPAGERRCDPCVVQCCYVCGDLLDDGDVEAGWRAHPACTAQAYRRGEGRAA